MILRRRRLWFVLFTGLVLAAGLWAWELHYALWVSDAKQITPGMMRDQVIAAFGRQPDADNVPDSQAKLWFAMDGRITVCFNSNDRVLYCNCVGENVFVWQFRRFLGMFQQGQRIS